MLDQSTYRKHKSALTRAVNSGDGRKLLNACRKARIDFERDGYPDEWHRWPRACDSAASRAMIDTDKYGNVDEALIRGLHAESRAWQGFGW
jgi:hypothetical protein